MPCPCRLGTTVLQDSYPLKGIGRINSGNLELQAHPSATLGECQFVSELFHNEDTFAMDLIVRG